MPAEPEKAASSPAPASGASGSTATGSPAAGSDEPLEIDLKNPWLAAVLAWAVPGLGHIYQGRYAKGLIFFVAILGTFFAGVMLGGNDQVGWGRVVYFTREHSRPAFICQMFVGLAAMPAVYQYRLFSQRTLPAASPLKKFMWPPRAEEGDDARKSELDELHLSLHRFFELGTVYTMVAGLLNILVIFDAFAGPAPVVDDRPTGDAKTGDAKTKDEKEPTDGKPDGKPSGKSDGAGERDAKPDAAKSGGKERK